MRFFLIIVWLFLGFNSNSYALEITESSSLSEITSAFNEGREAEIQGIIYGWEDGVIFKLKNGKKRKLRGIKQIVKASVSPRVSTTVRFSNDCSSFNINETRALKLLKSAMKTLPAARFEYGIQSHRLTSPECIHKLSKELEKSLTVYSFGDQLSSQVSEILFQVQHSIAEIKQNSAQIIILRVE